MLESDKFPQNPRTLQMPQHCKNISGKIFLVIIKHSVILPQGDSSKQSKVLIMNTSRLQDEYHLTSSSQHLQPLSTKLADNTKLGHALKTEVEAT